MFVAQLVNFAILITALTFLVFKPIIATLEKRQKKISDSLKDAERIGEELRSAEDKSKAIIAEARAEAGKVVKAAEAAAEAVRSGAADKARAEVNAIIASGKSALAAEKEAMLGEIRAVAADLVTHATEKVIGEKMDSAADKRLVDKVVKEI